MHGGIISRVVVYFMVDEITRRVDSDTEQKLPRLTIIIWFQSIFSCFIIAYLLI